MAPIDALPVELFTLIAQGLVSADLGHLRVSSSRIAAILTPTFKSRYFSSLSSNLTQGSLDWLQQVLCSHLSNNLKDLTITGGLVDGNEIRTEYYGLISHQWSSLPHRVLLNLEASDRCNSPPYVDLLSNAIANLPGKQIKRLTVEKPSPASLSFSTEEVRRAIAWKTLTITLQALAKSQVTVESFKATGFTSPFGLEYMCTGLETSFKNTKSLELDFTSIVDPNKLIWLPKFLHCFEQLEEATICMSHPRRTQHDREPFSLALTRGLNNKPLRKLVLGSGPASIHFLLSYLEERHMDEQAEQFRTHVQPEQTRTALLEEPTIKLDNIEMHESSDIRLNFTHTECCQQSIELSGFQRGFAAFRKHVEESESLMFMARY